MLMNPRCRLSTQGFIDNSQRKYRSFIISDVGSMCDARVEAVQGCMSDRSGCHVGVDGLQGGSHVKRMACRSGYHVGVETS